VPIPLAVGDWTGFYLLWGYLFAWPVSAVLYRRSSCWPNNKYFACLFTPVRTGNDFLSSSFDVDWKSILAFFQIYLMPVCLLDVGISLCAK
jgi:hypothetical protein